jgi:PPOX class probable FMN-dependent enzyme
MSKIESLNALRSIIGSPSELVPLKIHRTLNDSAREFIGKSPMLMLTTADESNQPTVSPKGDLPGFVRVEDDATLLIPERKGNKLVFSLSNILGNPRVGLIFLLPGTCETLRVQGMAELHDDAALCARMSARGNPALLVMKVTVTECYFHCAKAFLRGQLWESDAWPDPMKISFGREIAANASLQEPDIEAFDRGVAQRYKTDL